MASSDNVLPSFTTPPRHPRQPRASAAPEGSGEAIIVDPIDGTRCLMYDKRSAWFLAGCAPLNASMGSLQSIEHAALVEIPTSKQNKSDLILADRNRRLRAFSFDLVTRNYHEFFPRPSREKSLMNGFAHVANFFPGTKVLASELMELIAAEFASDECAVGSLIFDDQYISTGGQLVELLLGRDRFCCDLRPLFYQIHYNQGCEPSGARLACHPYDLAGMLAAVMGGVLLTDPWGRPLDAPLDTCTEVAWCGFANERLMSRINPVIQKWLERHGISNKGG